MPIWVTITNAIISFLLLISFSSSLNLRSCLQHSWLVPIFVFHSHSLTNGAAFFPMTKISIPILLIPLLFPLHSLLPSHGSRRAFLWHHHRQLRNLWPPHMSDLLLDPRRPICMLPSLRPIIPPQTSGYPIPPLPFFLPCVFYPRPKNHSPHHGQALSFSEDESRVATRVPPTTTKLRRRRTTTPHSTIKSSCDLRAPAMFLHQIPLFRVTLLALFRVFDARELVSALSDQLTLSSLCADHPYSRTHTSAMQARVIDFMQSVPAEPCNMHSWTSVNSVCNNNNANTPSNIIQILSCKTMPWLNVSGENSKLLTETKNLLG